MPLSALLKRPSDASTSPCGFPVAGRRRIEKVVANWPDQATCGVPRCGEYVAEPAGVHHHHATARRLHAWRAADRCRAVEHRQVEQLRRVVQREAARFSEAAAQQFELVIRAEREEAARRLSRELDLAVERFAREAEGDLAERVEQLAQSAVSRVETKLSTIDAGFERARNDATAAMARRTAEAEADLRGRLEAVAREAEAARSAIENRLHDLARRFDDLAART